VDSFCGPAAPAGSIGGMSFEDLPADWPHRPLTDPDFVHDVLDLCVSDAARREGGLAFLALRPDLTLAQPTFVAGELPRLERHTLVRNLVQALSHVEPDARFVVGIAHRHSDLTDADREVHQVVLEVCAEQGADVLSTHLVTASGITALPGPLRRRRVA
jgi:hypothetical protein